MHKSNTAPLEAKLGYSFRDRALLREALTHSSYFHENASKARTYNERLEFLGDSVLGFAIVEYLFLLDSGLSESVMAKTKSYLVKESVLSETARAISLGDYLRLGKGEEATGGRTKRSLLADAVEALFGAVYIDAGYEVARDLILRLFKEKIERIVSSGEFLDFKTDLQEKTQQMFGVIPGYRLIRQEGKEHRKVFTVEVYIGEEKFGEGSGKNKKEAETLAAREALGKLEE